MCGGCTGDRMEEQQPLLRTAIIDIAAHGQSTQVLSALFACVSAASGIIILQTYGTGNRLEAAVMLVVALLCALVGLRALKPLSELERKRLSDALSALILAAYTAPLMFSVWGPPMADEQLSAFRPIFGFTFFVYLGLIMLQPSREGLRRLWVIYVAQLAVVVSGAYWHTGLDLGRDGMPAMLLWLVFGNAVFIVLLHSLAFYARALRRFGREAVAAQALRSSEEYLQLVLHSMQVGAWGWRLEGAQQSWGSPRFRELIGWDKADADAPSMVLGLLHPDDREGFAETAASQLAADSLFDVTARLRRCDGDYRWFNVRGHVVRAEDGAIREVVGAILDVDEQVRSEQALVESHERLTYLAYHDVLTGLRNRRFFLERFEQELARARRENQALSLLIVDIDHFKPYNDCYGHSAGDEALKAVAQCLKDSARRGVDLAARFGGEEFAVLLQNTDAAGALQVAEAMCRCVQDAAIPHARAPLRMLTISAGATTLLPSEQPVTNIDLMIEEADAALYRVKSSGRNRAWHYLDSVNDGASAAG